jgi:hypothetical protein
MSALPGGRDRLADCRRRRLQRRAVVVLNRVPPRSALTERLVADLCDPGMTIAASHIGKRVALAQGLGVVGRAAASPAPRSRRSQMRPDAS